MVIKEIRKSVICNIRISKTAALFPLPHYDIGERKLVIADPPLVSCESHVMAIALLELSGSRSARERSKHAEVREQTLLIRKRAERLISPARGF